LAKIKGSLHEGRPGSLASALASAEYAAAVNRSKGMVLISRVAAGLAVTGLAVTGLTYTVALPAWLAFAYLVVAGVTVSVGFILSSQNDGSSRHMGRSALRSWRVIESGCRPVIVWSRPLAASITRVAAAMSVWPDADWKIRGGFARVIAPNAAYARSVLLRASSPMSSI